jgi:hypothetical protein
LGVLAVKHGKWKIKVFHNSWPQNRCSEVIPKPRLGLIVLVFKVLLIRNLDVRYVQHFTGWVLKKKWGYRDPPNFGLNQQHMGIWLK